MRKMRTGPVFGWVVIIVGVVLWTYGYYVTGHPALIDWPDRVPSWIAEFLPNIESEIGLALTVIGMVPIYWPVNTPQP